MEKGCEQFSQMRLRFKFLDREQKLRDRHTKLLQRLMEDKLSEMSGLRNENREMQKEMLTRSEYKSAHESLMRDVASTQKFVWIGMGAFVIIQILVVALLGYFLRK